MLRFSERNLPTYTVDYAFPISANLRIMTGVPAPHSSRLL
jgi:hypothetical protein